MATLLVACIRRSDLDEPALPSENSRFSEASQDGSAAVHDVVDEADDRSIVPMAPQWLSCKTTRNRAAPNTYPSRNVHTAARPTCFATVHPVPPPVRAATELALWEIFHRRYAARSAA